MHALRHTLLLVGLVSLGSGITQIAAGSGVVPWARVERHVRQTLAMGRAQPVLFVDLRQSYTLLMHSALGPGP